MYLVGNNNVRSVKLEIKTTGVKSLKYFVLFPENVFSEKCSRENVLGKRKKY